jgi:transcriptional regulator with XRE-family HTH domain/tetratricopeptide (TPR) repeat protein
VANSSTWSAIHGDALRDRRKRVGLTQEELAERAGISVKTVSLVEGGGVEPRPSTLRLIAEALECRVDDLLRGDGPRHEASVARIVPESRDSGGVYGSSPLPAPEELEPEELDLVVLPERSRDRKLRRGHTIVIAALVAIVAATAIWLVTRTFRAAELDPKLVAVAIFENRSGDPALDPVGEQIADRLVQGLSESGIADGVATLTMLRYSPGANGQGGTLLNPAQLRSLAASTGAGVVVSGAYDVDGGHFQVLARISDAVNDELIYAVPFAGGSADSVTEVIGIAQNRILGALAAHFDWRLPSPSVVPPPRFEAYSEFRAAHYEWRSRDLIATPYSAVSEEEARAVIDHFERAAELDPRFMAPLIALQHFAQFYMQDLARADSAMARVSRQREILTPFESVWLDAVIAGREENWPRSLRMIRRALQLDPGNQSMQRVAGVVAQIVNRSHESIEMLEDLVPDAQGHASYSHLCWSHHRLGAYERELELAREYRQRFPDQAKYAVGGSLPSLAALGKTDEVRQVVEQCLAVRQVSTSEALYVFYVAVGELRWHGYREAALEVAARAVDYYSSRPAEETAHPGHRWNLVACLYMAERWDEARSIYEQLADEYPGSTWPKTRLGTLAARRGDRERAVAILEELHEREEFDNCARITALLGEREQAVEFIQEARRHGTWYQFPHAVMDFESLKGYEPFEELMKPRG